jgi:hypothetical protein
MHCPFFKSEKLLRLSCEGAALKFPDKEARKEHIGLHCANRKGWHDCAIAKMLMNYYDRKDDQGDR